MILEASHFILERSKIEKGAFSWVKRCLLQGLKMPSLRHREGICFLHRFVRARMRAHLQSFFKNICTSALLLYKLLNDNEIDRCRYGDNSDRYLSIWPLNPYFFEENLQKKEKNAQNLDKKAYKTNKKGIKLGQKGSMTKSLCPKMKSFSKKQPKKYHQGMRLFLKNFSAFSRV